MRNAGLHFVCRQANLRVENSQSLFTCGYENGQILRVPVAHMDGNYFADDTTLDRLEGEGRVALRYATPEGVVDPDAPAANPNGPVHSIAGIFNEQKTIPGLMPHPETPVDPPHARE